MLENYDKLQSIIQGQPPVSLTKSEYEYSCSGTGVYSTVNKRINFLLGREADPAVLT